MKKTTLISLFFLSGFIILMVQIGNQKKEAIEDYQIIENYIQLNGKQLLSDITNTTLPFSKQGYSLHLPKSKPKATLIFLSGSALDTTRTIAEFNIIKPAIENDIAVLFVSTGKVIEFLFTNQDIQIVDDIIGNALKTHKLIESPKFIAGMSLGGTMALKYAEYCFLKKSKYDINPNAIVICDSPLDMVRMWHEQEQAIKNNFHPNAVGEAKWVLHFLKNNLGGSPKEAMENYINYSPFVYTDENKSKIQLYSSVPIRMYHEPDINWWVQNRAKDYNTINSIDLAGFYNYLRLAGNKEVELITSSKKRKDYDKGTSPHTWTIVDNNELVQWLLKKI